LAGEEPRAQEPEDVVDERFRHRDVRVLREPGRLEAGMAELGDENLERHAVLEGHRRQHADRVHEPGDRTPLLRHLDEDLPRRTVLEEAYVEVALVSADVEFVADRLAVVWKPPPD